MTEREHEATFEPGIYPDIPAATYHASYGVSKSQLDLVHQAPALLEWSRNAPRDEDVRTAADIGTALHCALLEPERFTERYCPEFAPPAEAIVTTEDVRAALDARGIAYPGRDSKQALLARLLDFEPDAPVLETLRSKWARDADGKVVLTEFEGRKIQLMRQSVMAHPFARRILEAPGRTEISMYYRDQETGEIVRARLDKEADLGNVRINADVKMTEDVDDFWRSVEDYRYHVQDAVYTTATEVLCGETRPFVFIVVGSKKDAGRYRVRTFVLPEWMREEGRQQMRADIDTYHRCRTTRTWPGIEVLAPPPWRAKQITTG